MSNITSQHEHHDTDVIDVFGFWLYIMTDCILFGAIFATYIVLNYPGAYGPALKPLIDLYYVLGETMFLLLSNFAFGLAILASYKDRNKATMALLALTFVLGIAFIIMEINEFIHLVHLGYKWDVSGAASAFFTLVATHGLHVFFGLVWIIILTIQLSKFGLNNAMQRRLTYLGLFWNFLDIVWIFVFTIVYLLGAV